MVRHPGNCRGNLSGDRGGFAWILCCRICGQPGRASNRLFGCGCTIRWGRRGKTCFWFYLSTAGWRTALSASATVLSFAVIDHFAGIPVGSRRFCTDRDGLPGRAGCLVAVRDFGHDLHCQRRDSVFVIPNLKRLCRGDFDSISIATRKRRVNWAIFVLLTSVFIPVLTVGLLTAMRVRPQNPRTHPPQPRNPPAWPFYASARSRPSFRIPISQAESPHRPRGIVGRRFSAANEDPFASTGAD